MQFDTVDALSKQLITCLKQDSAGVQFAAQCRLHCAMQVAAVAQFIKGAQDVQSDFTFHNEVSSSNAASKTGMLFHSACFRHQTCTTCRICRSFAEWTPKDDPCCALTSIAESWRSSHMPHIFLKLHAVSDHNGVPPVNSTACLFVDSWQCVSVLTCSTKTHCPHIKRSLRVSMRPLHDLSVSLYADCSV